MIIKEAETERVDYIAHSHFNGGEYPEIISGEIS